MYAEGRPPAKKGRPPGTKNPRPLDQKIDFVLDMPFLIRIRTAANALGISAAELMRRAIHEFLVRNGF